MTRTLLLAAIATAGIVYSATTPPGDASTRDIQAATFRSETVTLTQAAAAPSRMPIYITPYYNSDPLKVDVGRYSQELVSATADSISELAATMKKEWATLPVETMYVLAIRLYDLGHKDDAVDWFYSAQFRARLLSALLPAGARGGFGDEGFERAQAHRSFQQLAGTYINGYAFGELDQLEKTLRQVKSESEQLPQFKKIYPRLELIEEDLWAVKNQEVSTNFDKLLGYIVDNAEEIKAIRKQRGMEGKY